MNHEELSIRSSEFEMKISANMVQTTTINAVFLYKKIHDNEYPLQNYKGCLNVGWRSNIVVWTESQALTFFNIFFIYAPSLIYWSTVHVEEGRRGETDS